MNGKVKSRFAAHDDFLQTVTLALIREYVLEHYGMDNENSDITKNNFPENVEHMHKKTREKVFSETMDGLLKDLLIAFWVNFLRQL